jgi:hypothetical protein
MRLSLLFWITISLFLLSEHRNLKFDSHSDALTWVDRGHQAYEITGGLSFILAFSGSLICVGTRLAMWKRAKGLVSPGLCRKCGYDLRATPDRCPECGTVPPIKKIASN